MMISTFTFFILFFSLYRVSSKSLAKEKCEYLRHTSTKWTDIFIIDKRVFIAHVHKRNVVKNRFKVLTINFHKEM
jgi:hypothetical protein